MLLTQETLVLVSQNEDGPLYIYWLFHRTKMDLYIYIYIYIYTHTHTYIYTHTHTHTQSCKLRLQIRDSPVGGKSSSAYRTASTLAKPYVDESGCTIHVDIYYTVHVLGAIVFMKMSPRV